MDRTRQLNSGSNNQNQKSPNLSVGGSHSSSSLIAGSGQRFPYRLVGLNINLSPQGISANIVPNNGFNACASLHESTVGTELIIPSLSNSLTVSLQRLQNNIRGLAQTQDKVMNPDINPDESPPYQFGTNSATSTNADNHSRELRYVVEEQCEDTSIATNTVRLPFKRSSTNSGREFHIGESSNMGSQVEIAEQHVGATSHDNVINTSPLSIGPTYANSQPRGFRGATSVSEMQDGQSESNTSLQTIPAATIEQDFVRPNPDRFSSSYTRGLQVHSLGHAPLVSQLEHPPFFNHIENSNGASSLRQPTEIDAHTFLRDLSGSPSITNMNIRNPIAITIIDSSQIGRNEDGQRSMHIYEIHDGENDEQPPPRVPSIAEMRNDIEAQAQAALERLHSGQVLRVQDMIALNHSLAIHIIEAQVADVVDDFEDMEVSMIPGLPEELIMKYIKIENFVLGDKESQEACCICQEEYANGVEVGKLDCEHIFHIECIKQWLNQKNECPICRKKALETFE
ncbi:Zinc finger, RING-type [Sesbania bispinosa]|nr:Zinc finger, RING-type [Sesbania bispinosa]